MNTVVWVSTALRADHVGCYGARRVRTPTIDALYVPDIDESLDEEGAKQRFWRSFRMLGTWYEDLPPY